MSDDWFDILAAMVAANARFLVIGAHAMAVHGVPRATQDLDIWIDPTTENAERVWQALAAFGAPLTSVGITKADFETPGVTAQIGLPPNRIDILTDISGIEDFETAWRERREHAVRNLVVPFLGRAALVTNKRASGRRKDLVDLEALGELPKE